MGSRGILRIFIGLLAVLAVVYISFQIGKTIENNKQREKNSKMIIQEKDLKVRTQVVLNKLDTPWSLALIQGGGLIFTERKGKIKVGDVNDISNVAEIDADIKVSTEGEGGLLGIAAHPDFPKNNYIYIYYTYKQGRNMFNKVERFYLDIDAKKLTKKITIVDHIPGNIFHNGGRIKFGPDKKLYVTTGDAENPVLAQDIESLAGKILRLNDDGSIPADNPFRNSPVYSLGHRNPQGIAWHPETGQMFATEHGSVANDEINFIVKGGNYGWPEEQGRGSRKLKAPVLLSGVDTWAPSGTDFYKADNKAKNNMFFAALRGMHLHLVVFDDSGKVLKSEKLLTGKFGRLRDVVYGADGALYVLTSNRDGRGIPSKDDDMIIKIAIE